MKLSFRNRLVLLTGILSLLLPGLSLAVLSEVALSHLREQAAATVLSRAQQRARLVEEEYEKALRSLPPAHGPASSTPERSGARETLLRNAKLRTALLGWLEPEEDGGLPPGNSETTWEDLSPGLVSFALFLPPSDHSPGDLTPLLTGPGSSSISPLQEEELSQPRLAPGELESLLRRTLTEGSAWSSSSTVRSHPIRIFVFLPLRADQEIRALLALEAILPGYESVQNRLRLTGLALVAGGAALFLLFVSLAAGRVLHPLVPLRKEAERIRNLQWGPPLPVETSDEVGLLTEEINALAADLRSYTLHLEGERNRYFRFTPTRFLEILEREPREEGKSPEPREREVTLLYSDIRSFTTLSESMTAGENLRFLHEYFTAMSRPIERLGGVVEKYVGDSLLALFPAPGEGAPPASDSTGDLSGSADRALRAAIEMRTALKRMELREFHPALASLEMGVGIATGSILLGTLDVGTRTDTVMIGRTVKHASLLERLTVTYDAPLLLWENTYRSLADPSRYGIRELDLLSLKGESEPVRVYEAFDGEEEDSRSTKMASRATLERGILLYREGRFEEAANVFRKGAEEFPGERIFRIYDKRCGELRRNPPSRWRGAVQLRIK